MSDIPRKSAEVFTFRVVNQAASVLTGILLARFLGPYGKGIFTYVGTVMSVLQTLSGGQSSSVAWQYGRHRRPAAAVFRATLQLLLYVCLPISVVLLVAAFILPHQLPLVYVAIAMPFSWFAQSSLGFFLADSNVRIVNVQSLIASLGFLILLVPVLFIFHNKLSAVLILWVCSSIAVATYAAVKVRPYARSGAREHPGVVKDQAVFGAKVSANQLMSLLNFRVDVFIILFMLGATALGIYSIAIGFGELMFQVTRPLGLASFGKITSGSRAEAAELTAKCVRHTLVLVCLGCAVIFVVGPPLISLVYGSAFAGAGTVLRYLLPGILAYSMTPFFAGFFSQQLGKPNIQLGILSLSSLICAVVTILTVRSLGIVGGAIATSISYMAAFAISITVFMRESGMRFQTIFRIGRDDIQPYQTLLRSAWNRTRLAFGKRA